MSELFTSLMSWLWPASLAFSVLAIALLLGHRTLLAWFGARTMYPLWLLLPVALGLPILAQLVSPVFSIWLQPAEHAPWQSWTTLPGASTIDAASSAVMSPWLVAAALLWLVPAVVLIAVFAQQYLRLRRQPCARYKGLKVQWQTAGSSPGISGLFSPRLQLPRDFASRFSRSEQRLIIQHELTHWRRHDLQVNAFAWLLLACQWFNPLAWKAYQRFRADQELACDASVLATQHASRPQDLISKQVCYANALLAAMQSVSLNAHSRNLWSTAACTHYGIAQGERAMAQERFNQLNQHHQPRRWPALLGASLVTLAGLAWLGPVAASSIAQDSNVADNEAAPAAQPIVRVEPRYPAAAVEQGLEGYVDLSFVITDQGTVANVDVIRAEPEGVFTDAAVAALERWRYAPQNDLPQQIRLQFALDHD